MFPVFLSPKISYESSKKKIVQGEYLSFVHLNISLSLIQQHFSIVIASPRQEDTSDQVLQATSEI